VGQPSRSGIVSRSNVNKLDVPLSPDTPVEQLPGIGERRARVLRAQGICTALDCLLNLPRRYEDWRVLSNPRELRPGATVTMRGTLRKVAQRAMASNRKLCLMRARFECDGTSVPVVWFNFSPHLAAQIPFDCEVLIHGKVAIGMGALLQIVNPVVEQFSGEEALSLRPVYRVPSTVGQRTFARLVSVILDQLDGRFEGAIPESLRRSSGLLEPIAALRFVHRPPSSANLEDLMFGRTAAHQVLALEELFAFQLALHLESRRAAQRRGHVLPASDGLSQAFLKSLPFELTNAQKRVLAEIDVDLVSGTPMNRLLIGEVGSGKTVVALWSALRAVECGWQAAVMAPIGLLAEQHYQTAARYVEGLGVRCALLTSAVTGKERAQRLRDIACGRAQIVFGTQALLKDSVRFTKLGLAVIDEQHRFGVFDRARLKSVAPNSHMLLMTATPIPRSLALVLFANLNVSFLDEVPAGRARVQTRIVPESRFEEVESIVLRRVEEGGRAYFVLPVIGEDIASDDELDDEGVASVKAIAERLRAGKLSRFRAGILHGRMAQRAREATMRAFREGALDILVATTLVEVGVDVPEANAIVIVNAERYGLAQLHQLRGRVGRGNADSDCILLVKDDACEQAFRRLSAILRSTSGIEIAKADMELRGPGDLLGSRQSGALPLRFARFVHDAELISQARAMAHQTLLRDPELAGPETSGARRAVKRLLAYGFSLADVG